MKFKTPSKPVVTLAYHTDGKIQKNANSIVRRIFTVSGGSSYISGEFLSRADENQERNYLKGCVSLSVSKALYFIENEKPTLSKSLDLCRVSRKSNSPGTKQTIES